MTSILRSNRDEQNRDNGQTDADKEDKKGRRSGGEEGQRVKSSHIISEFIECGVPHSVAYAQWSQYDKWSEMFKKESAPPKGNGNRSRRNSGGNEAREVTATSKIGPSQRQWQAEIVERVPDRRIVWRAKGGIQAKGVTSFHQLDDRLTQLMVEIEYRPSGFLETIGNFFRMQRRRVRKDLKLFKNYIELKAEPTGEGPGRVQGDGLKEDVDQQVGDKQEG
jgi:uncharacterized membrane protein